eukprot:568069-Prymnesium_polylepis.1
MTTAIALRRCRGSTTPQGVLPPLSACRRTRVHLCSASRGAPSTQSVVTTSSWGAPSSSRRHAPLKSVTIALGHRMRSSWVYRACRSTSRGPGRTSPAHTPPSRPAANRASAGQSRENSAPPAVRPRDLARPRSRASSSQTRGQEVQLGQGRERGLRGSRLEAGGLAIHGSGGTVAARRHGRACEPHPR